MLGIFILIVFFSFIVIVIKCFINLIETFYYNHYKSIVVGEHYFNDTEVIVDNIDKKYVVIKSINGSEYKITKKELLLYYNKK